MCKPYTRLHPRRPQHSAHSKMCPAVHAPTAAYSSTQQPAHHPAHPARLPPPATPPCLRVVVERGLLLGLHRGDALHKVLVAHLGAVAPQRQHARLHAHRLELRGVEVVGRARQLLKVDVARHVHLARVDAQDLGACVLVGVRELDLAVEAARAHERRVQDVGAVGGGNHNDASVALEAVHLSQQLVQGLLTLVVATANAGATRAADGVNLIHEHQAGRVLLGLLEQVAHARRAHAHKHLDELRARDGEEGHARLAGDGLGQQGLAGTGGAHQQAALGDARAHGGEALRALQELHNLHEVLLGLLHTGDIVEGHAGVGLHLELGARLAEGHRVAGATGTTHTALGTTGQQEQTADQQQREREVAQQVQEHSTTVLGVGVGSEVDLLLAELLQQLRAGARHLDTHALHAVAQLRGHSLNNGNGAILVQVHLLHTTHLQVLQEARVGHARGRHSSGILSTGSRSRHQGSSGSQSIAQEVALGCILHLNGLIRLLGAHHHHGSTGNAQATADGHRSRASSPDGLHAASALGQHDQKDRSA
mmetsp:Transcript_18452/g.46683  ORF Transcript_18452/g.46683 Transcript_18452/m.46683 type:complete len:537 (-) Transcript_18452:109-1719(-)